LTKFSTSRPGGSVKGLKIGNKGARGEKREGQCGLAESNSSAAANVLG